MERFCPSLFLSLSLSLSLCASPFPSRRSRSSLTLSQALSASLVLSLSRSLLSRRLSSLHSPSSFVGKASNVRWSRTFFRVARKRFWSKSRSIGTTELRFVFLVSFINEKIRILSPIVGSMGLKMGVERTTERDGGIFSETG